MIRRWFSRLLVFGGWMVPLILSLLPVALGFWDLQSDRLRLLEEKRQDSLEQTSQSAQQLRTCSDLSFWGEEAARRLRKEIEETIQGPGGDSLAIASLKAKKNLDLKGLPPWRLWVAEIPDGDFQQRGRLCTGEGLEDSFKPVMQMVIPALARQHIDPRQPLNARDELSRLRVMFGDMTLPELFSEDRRGKPFHTIIQFGYHLAVWDLIFRDNRPVGGFFCLFPIPQDPGSLALKLTFQNWKLFFPQPQLSCAFLPYPLQPGPATGTIFCHARLRRPDVMPHLQELMHRQEIIPNRNSEVLGDVRLLASLVGQYESLGNWWFRVCPLHPQAGKVGVLCLPQPTVHMPVRERLARILLGLWLMGWGVILVFRLMVGRMPVPGVRLGLVLWFLGLVSVPTMLSISTSISFLSDLESNLHHQKRQEMTQMLREIEAGSTSLSEKYGSTLRNISLDPALCKNLLKAQNGEESPERIVNELWQQIASQEIQLMGVLIFGHGGFSRDAFHSSVSPDVQRAFRQFVGEFGDSTLRQADPELYQKGQERLKATGGKGPRRGQFEGLASTSFLLTQMDSSADFRMGRRHLMKYHNSLGFDGHTYFAIFFIWDQDPLYWKYLQTAVPEANRQFAWMSLGAFRDRRDFLETLWNPRQGSEVSTWAEQARGQPLWNRNRDRLILAYPSKRMPGYILAAHASLFPVQRALNAETRRLVLSLVLLVVLVVLSAAGLSHWLANPILRMTEGLRQIAAGNLQIQVAENRDDELGEAGNSLDTMTGWLRERRLMTCFVAPQVLELIQNGTMDQSLSATTREAVALVSDIRNFTTLSETHPPAEVFAALNYHLQVMTRVIREQNGYIDRFIGDAIQAVFYPGDVPAAVRAVRAAAGMRRGHHLIQVHRERQKKFRYEIGMGIDGGTLVTGVLGDPDVRQEYTVLGEPMKHAADLEALSKQGQATRIVCSTLIVQQSGYQDLFQQLPGHDNVWELMQLPEENRR